MGPTWLVVAIKRDTRESVVVVFDNEADARAVYDATRCKPGLRCYLAACRSEATT